MQFAYSTILNAPRFGWQSAPSESERLDLYGQVRKLGFEGIEWSPRWFDLFELSDGKIRELRCEADAYDLKISAINLNRFMLTRCAETSDHRARLLHAVKAAALLGSSLVIISLSLPQPPTPWQPELTGDAIPDAEFAETATLVKRAAVQAGEHGVGLVLELHDDGLLDSASQCIRMLELVDEPNVSLNPDLGNLIRRRQSTGKWRETLAALASRSGYWHVKNYRRGQPVAIWEGDIDYADAMDLMRQNGFDGWVSIESYFGDNIMQLQSQSLAWLRSVISRDMR